MSPRRRSSATSPTSTCSAARSTRWPARVGEPAARLGVLRPHRHAQAAPLRLHHAHPLADAAPAHRRRAADRRDRPPAARRRGHLRRPAAARRRRLGPVGLRAGRPVRRGTDRRESRSPDVVTARCDAPEAAARRRHLPVERRWWPGQDVRHDELGAGWVWGRGLGRVTVRFEGPRTAPGPVRTLAADDPLLQPADPARLEDARMTPARAALLVGLGDDRPRAPRRRVRRRGGRAAGPARAATSRARRSPTSTSRRRGSTPPAVPARVSTAVADRAAHTYGKAYRDVVRALAGDLRARRRTPWRSPGPRPTSSPLLDWAGSAGIAVVPYGGGSSVVGGVEYRGDGPAGSPWTSPALDRVLEVDRVSRAARIQGGRARARCSRTSCARTA